MNIFWLIMAMTLAVTSVGCDRLMSPLLPPKRLSDSPGSIVLPDSIILERDASGTSLTLGFETRVAAQCKVGFQPSASIAGFKPEALTTCAGKSSTKFSEMISGVPRDQLITVYLKTWPAESSEPIGGFTKIAEVPPSADAKTVHLVLTDLDAKWLELTAIEDSRAPSDIIAELLKIGSPTCALVDSKEPGFNGTRKATFIQSATFRGLINTTLTRVATSTLASSFNMAQLDSTEWTVTARTAEGFGQLRLAKPALLAKPIFAAAQQSEGLDDDLADIDPPTIKILSGGTVVATWAVDGDPKTAVTTLTVQRAPGFPGIVCTANAGAGRLVIPSDLVAKIPSGQKLWATLRMDSWQSFDRERWLVRASQWTSMGLQRF